MRAFEAAQLFFDDAAEYLNLEPELRETLLMPHREVQVQVTIERDNGHIANYVGPDTDTDIPAPDMGTDHRVMA